MRTEAGRKLNQSDRKDKLSLSLNFLSFFKMEINFEVINDDICHLFYFSFILQASHSTPSGHARPYAAPPPPVTIWPAA